MSFKLLLLQSQILKRKIKTRKPIRVKGGRRKDSLKPKFTTMIILTLVNKSNINKVRKIGMCLSSKFKMNEMVYVIYDYKIHTGNIVRIDGSVQLNGSVEQQTILYTLELPDVNKTVQLSEEFCFTSKKSLIDSLSI